MPLLTNLYLESNQLEGTLPASLFHLKRLSYGGCSGLMLFDRHFPVAHGGQAQPTRAPAASKSLTMSAVTRASATVQTAAAAHRLNGAPQCGAANLRFVTSLIFPLPPCLPQPAWASTSSWARCRAPAAANLRSLYSPSPRPLPPAAYLGFNKFMGTLPANLG